MTKKGATSDTTAPVDKIEMSDEARHRFLAYLMPQLEPLRQACEHNWLIQAVLITLASFQLYNSRLVNGVASAARIPVESLDLIIPLVLTYLLIRFGYLLNAYLFIRDGISETLKAFSVRPAVFEPEPAERMLRSNSLVELFCLNFKRTSYSSKSAALAVLPLLMAATFALNHALVFLYLGRLVGHRRNLSIPIGLAIVLLLGVCYMHFFEKANRRGARIIAIGSICLTPILFLIMHRTVYGLFL